MKSVFRYSILPLITVIIGIAGFLAQGCITLDSTDSPAIQAYKPYLLFPTDASPGLDRQSSLQGLSGLVFDKEVEGRLFFWSLTDRGPNQEPIEINGKKSRPFLDPSFQPRIYYFSIPRDKGQTNIEKVIYLTGFDSKGLRGLTPCGRPQKEENPVKPDGSPLDCDQDGIDPESLGVDSQGNFWVGEEYRPSVLQFSPNGRLLKAYVPEGTQWNPNCDSASITEKAKCGLTVTVPEVHAILPANFIQRLPNRGIEGLTIKDNLLYLMLQSPLKTDTDSSKISTIEIVKIDIREDKPVGTLLYPISAPKVDKIGDLALEDADHLLILEQNSKTGPESYHRIYRVDAKTPSPHSNTPVAKELVIDLVGAGYDQFEKIEGLTILPNHQIAVVNDNDFGVANGAASQTVLAIFTENSR
jgi:hypothetical protein